MQTKELIRRVEEMALPLCEQAGVTLWDVEFEKEGGQYMLTITIDRDGGVDIDHCEQISRAIDPMLDAKDFDSLPPYTLCVSSAGLERRLKKPEHFAKYIGETVEVKFYRAIDGAKIVEGRLMGYDNGNVTVEVGGQTVIYEAADVASVRLTVQF